MKSDKQIEILIGGLRVQSPPAVRQRIHAQIRKAWAQFVDQGQPLAFMSLKAKLGLAAAVVLLLGLCTHWADLSMTPAYGLQDTALAFEDIHHFHFLLKDGPDEEPSREAWVEYDSKGQLKHVRVDFYPQNEVMVWSEDVTRCWQKDSNELRLFEDLEYTDKIQMFAYRHDPNHALGYLRALEAKGDVEIDFQKRMRLDDPISFTVLYEPNTYLIGRPKPAMKEIFSVDPTSNLITRIDVYNEQDGQFQGPAIWEYVDYNQPMAAAFFALENEIPDDVTVFNTVGLDLGLEQGQLSNSEIAIKVVEAFLQACIDQNSTDAIQIFGYVSARQKQWIRDFVRKQDLVRILEIGTPLPPEPHQRGLLVPCTLESDHAGTSQTHTQTFHVREFVPGRWRIISVTHP